MPLAPTFDMSADDPEPNDFGLAEDDDIPDLEPADQASPATQGPRTAETAQDVMRCAACDSDALFPDYLGRLRCRACGSLEHYRIDRPTSRRAEHGQGEWHYVPHASSATPARGPLPPRGPPPGRPARTGEEQPAAGRRRRRNRRQRGDLAMGLQSFRSVPSPRP